jgi:hypothetical protein
LCDLLASMHSRSATSLETEAEVVPQDSCGSTQVENGHRNQINQRRALNPSHWAHEWLHRSLGTWVVASQSGHLGGCIAVCDHVARRSHTYTTGCCLRLLLQTLHKEENHDRTHDAKMFAPAAQACSHPRVSRATARPESSSIRQRNESTTKYITLGPLAALCLAARKWVTLFKSEIRH